MRVLMTGGGTAGHINPAIAIANTIKTNIPDAVIEFVGTERGLESRLVREAGYDIHYVNIMGISRSLSPKNIKAMGLMITSQFEAKKIIKSFKPDVVIGTGGYVCWPALKVAADMGIPTMVHESNARPGLAIKTLQGKMDKILVNFEDTKKYIKNPENAVFVGNPTRSGFGVIGYKEARAKLGIADDKIYILSFGGSLGAQKVNETVLSFMKNTVKGNEKLIHHHATGKGYFEEFTKRFAEAGLNRCTNLRLVEYINDMPTRMSAADIVISRAGAVSISEIAIAGRACVMIPSPNVVDNHQYKNAKVLADADAVVLLEEDYLNDEVFENEMISLIEDSAKRERLAKNVKKFANTDANKLIYDEIIALVKEKKR